MGWEEVAGAILISVITGAVAGQIGAQKTIAALVVHIDYLRSHVDRHEKSIERAHTRIDLIEREAKR